MPVSPEPRIEEKVLNYKKIQNIKNKNGTLIAVKLDPGLTVIKNFMIYSVYCS